MAFFMALATDWGPEAGSNLSCYEAFEIWTQNEKKYIAKKKGKIPNQRGSGPLGGMLPIFFWGLGFSQNNKK